MEEFEKTRKFKYPGSPIPLDYEKEEKERGFSKESVLEEVRRGRYERLRSELKGFQKE